MNMISSKRAALGRAGALALFGFGCASASAQTIDYATLQQTFGEPVTTSATGSPQRATDAPVNMTIVTAEDIGRSGAYDLPGVLKHVPGLDVLQWTHDSADIGVRGYNQPYSPRLLVLIDGRQVYADYYGFTPWSTLPVELGAIRQIEIVKGPSAALFGFNAVGGVINIVTYDPHYDDVNKISASAGSHGLRQGSATVTLIRNDRVSLRVMAGGRKDDDFRTTVPLPMAGSPWRPSDRAEISLTGNIRLAEKVNLRLDASHSDAAQNEVYPAHVFENARYLTDSVRAQLTADTDIGLLSLNAYANWMSLRLAAQGAPFWPPIENRVIVMQASDVFALGEHTFRVAGEYRHNSAGTVSFQGGTISYDVFSVSGMWSWPITSALSLTNAARMDSLSLARKGAVPPFYPFANADWDQDIFEVSFNSGLVWRAGEADTLRVMASRGVQLPSLVSFGVTAVYTGSFNGTGTPFAKPTIVENYELDWTHKFEGLPASLRVSLFHQSNYDVLSNTGTQRITFSGVWFMPDTIGDSHADGAEINLSGSFAEGWRWLLGYRFESVRDDFVPSAQNGASMVEFEHSTPRHLVNLNVGWTDGRWEIDGYARYQSRTTGLVQAFPVALAVQAAIPSYLSLDARLGYRFESGITAAFAVQNLGLDSQRQTAGPDVERSFQFTLSKSF